MVVLLFGLVTPCLPELGTIYFLFTQNEFVPLETASNSVPAISLISLFTESTIQLLNTSAGSRNPSEYSSFKLIVLHLPLASKKPFLFSSAFLVLSLYKDAYDNKLGLIVHPLGK